MSIMDLINLANRLDEIGLTKKNSVSSGVIVTSIINNSPCSFSIEVSKKNENMA